jgi:hypothetical protein
MEHLTKHHANEVLEDNGLLFWILEYNCVFSGVVHKWGYVVIDLINEMTQPVTWVKQWILLVVENS